MILLSSHSSARAGVADFVGSAGTARSAGPAGCLGSVDSAGSAYHLCGRHKLQHGLAGSSGAIVCGILSCGLIGHFGLFGLVDLFGLLGRIGFFDILWSL